MSQEAIRPKTPLEYPISGSSRGVEVQGLVD